MSMSLRSRESWQGLGRTDISEEFRCEWNNLSSRVKCGLEFRVFSIQCCFLCGKLYDGNFNRQWSQWFPKMSVWMQTWFNICGRRQKWLTYLYLGPLPFDTPIWGELRFCRTTYWKFFVFKSGYQGKEERTRKEWGRSRRRRRKLRSLRWSDSALCTRNITWATYVLLNFLVAILKEQK